MLVIPKATFEGGPIHGQQLQVFDDLPPDATELTWHIEWPPFYVLHTELNEQILTHTYRHSISGFYYFVRTESAKGES